MIGRYTDVGIQITLNIQDGQSAIENANDYAQNINAADGTLDYTVGYSPNEGSNCIS